MTVAPVKPAPPSSDAFLAAVKCRRSLYGLAKSSPIADEKIVEIVHTAVKHAPSAFNVQSSRAVVLFGSHHEAFWTVAVERFQPAVPPEFFSRLAPSLTTMKGAYGTVLLFEDSAAYDALAAKMPVAAPQLPAWSENAHGIVSYIIWTALEAEGLGASFQHYTDIVQKDVEELFQVPATWTLRANLVFGAPTVPPMEKAFQPLEDRVKVFA